MADPGAGSGFISARMRIARLVCAAMLAPSAAGAADWRLQPRASASETWSDNIGLASGAAASDDLVSELAAGFGLTGRGARLTLFMDYQLQGLHYANGSSKRTLNHELQTNGTAEVLADSLFLDFNAVAGLRNNTSTGRQSSDSVSVNANRGAFLTYGASPYYRMRVGSYADAEVRLRLDKVSSDGGDDSTIRGLSARLDSGNRFAVLPWTLSVSDLRSSPDTGASTSFRNIDLAVRRSFTRQYGVRVNAGYESNDLAGSSTSSSALTWRITGVWTPTERTNFEVGYGHRPFGNSFSMSASHRMRRAVLTAGYSEELTTGNINQSRAQLFPTQDAFGNAIDNPGASADRSVATDALSAGNSTVLQRRFNLGLAMQWRRTTASVSAYHDRRQTQVTAGGETVFGVNASASRRLSRLTSAAISSSWQRSDAGAAAGSEDETISLDLSLSRQFAKDLSGTVHYRHERESSQGTGGFTENRVSASLQMLF